MCRYHHTHWSSGVQQHCQSDYGISPSHHQSHRSCGLRVSYSPYFGMWAIVLIPSFMLLDMVDELAEVSRGCHCRQYDTSADFLRPASSVK